MTTEKGPARIEFLGPGLWRNHTGLFWQLLAFVPVDDERMIYYVRTYQKATGVFVFAWILGRLQRVFNRIVLRQDTPVVESQPRIETRLRGMNEILVPSDDPNHRVPSLARGTPRRALILASPQRDQEQLARARDLRLAGSCVPRHAAHVGVSATC